MLSTGLITIVFLAAALVLTLALGMRLDGWAGAIIGTVGIIYCYTATASLSQLPVWFLSWTLILYGVVALVVRRLQKSRPRG
jgi:hypothetical protein